MGTSILKNWEGAFAPLPLQFFYPLHDVHVLASSINSKLFIQFNTKDNVLLHTSALVSGFYITPVHSNMTDTSVQQHSRQAHELEGAAQDCYEG